MLELARDAAAAFRVGRHAEGSAKMVKFVDELVAWFAKNPSRTHAYLAPLDELLAAQAAGDDLRVADVLEYVLVPKLASDFSSIDTEK